MIEVTLGSLEPTRDLANSHIYLKFLLTLMPTAFIFHPDLEKYDFGKGHPFSGDRFKIFFDFFRARLTNFKDQFEVISPQPATDEVLQLVHSEEYIQKIRAASEGKVIKDIYRYVSLDNLDLQTNYIPLGIEKGSRLIVGSAVLAAELLAKGKFKNIVSIGGMHHAKPSYGEGFCFYNDIAILVKALKEKYNFKRILVLDTDAHAGNGTCEIFYDDPEVLFIDIHQDPRTLYPGTGFLKELGKGRGEGLTINLPLLPGTGNLSYQYIFEEVIFPLAQEFKPEVIIRYGGSDPHYQDALTDLGLTLEGFKIIGQKTRELADEFCQGRAISLLLSGYNLEVLPFAWSALIASFLNLEINLAGLKEESAPPADCHLEDTKDMVRELKKYLDK